MAVTAAFALAFPFRAEAPSLAYLLFLAVIGACAFAGGLRAGVIATATSFLAIGYFHAQPVGEILFPDATTLTFAFSSLVLSVLLGARGRIEIDRSELQSAVAIERERLEAILDSAHIGIGFLDSGLRFLQANEALAEIHGVPVREHLGRRIEDVAPWTPERVLSTLRGVLDGQPAVGIEVVVDDLRFLPVGRHLIKSFLPLHGPTGAVVGVGFTVNDVTRLKQGEAEQALLRAAAETAQRAADAANQMKDEVLITLSHEMRSPLQAILGWGRLLRGGQLDGKQADQAFETIERIVRQQAELLDGLFDVSRIMAGKMEIERIPVDISEIVRQAFDDKQFAARRQGVTLVCDAPTSASVVGDRERIHQILANLLTNAIKFTPGGGRVELRCTTEGRECVITVRDTGEGIPPDFIEHIFDRFSQADRSRGRLHGGLGLGLAIVEHLVGLHGGSVTAKSPGLGGGTTMTVRLPLASALTEAVARAPRIAVAPARLSGIRVLLVEDDVNVRESTVAFLEMRDAKVTAAESAGAGLEAFLRERPDIVISDLRLPGEDGYWLLQRIRALEAGRDVPAIAFSGNASADECAKSLAAGFAAHLIKPVDPEVLVRTLASTFARAPGVA